MGARALPPLYQTAIGKKALEVEEASAPAGAIALAAWDCASAKPDITKTVRAPVKIRFIVPPPIANQGMGSVNT